MIRFVWEFRNGISIESLVIRVIASNYDAALEKIKAMGIPDKECNLKVVSIDEIRPMSM